MSTGTVWICTKKACNGINHTSAHPEPGYRIRERCRHCLQVSDLIFQLGCWMQITEKQQEYDYVAQPDH